MAAENRFKFSDKRIMQIKAPAVGSRLSFYDSRLPELELRVGSSGRKTFNVYCWSKSRKQAVRIKIGTFPALGTAEVRRQARELVSRIKEGRSTRSLRAGNKLTLGELFRRVEADYYAPRASASVNDYRATFNKHLSIWGDRPLKDIAARDVRWLMREIRRKCQHRSDLSSAAPQQDVEFTGNYAANKALRLLSSLFGRAQEYGYDGGNPTDGVPLFPEEKRVRFLRSGELNRLFQSLDQESNKDVVDFVKLALFTGAKKATILQMKWEDIDFKAGLWRIAGRKKDSSYSVPLTSEAVSILRGRRGYGSPYVFPSGANWKEASHKPYMSDPKRAWQRIRLRAGLEDLRINDLRRTFGTWQAATGTPLSIIAKSLGRRSRVRTRESDAPRLNLVREAAETAQNAMLTAGGARTQAKVLDFQRYKKPIN